jgi:hypothetical protein
LHFKKEALLQKDLLLKLKARHGSLQLSQMRFAHASPLLRSDFDRSDLL